MELAIRMMLAAVFAWAGIAKLSTLSRFAATLGTHGLPRGLRRPAAATIATAEVAVGVVLASGLATRVAAIAATTLSALFAAVLIRARLRGQRRSSCGCFGRNRPANTVLLIGRAAALAAAGAVLASGVADVRGPQPETMRSAALAALGILVIGLTLAVLALYRQVGVLSLRLNPQTALELEDEGPPVGHPAPLYPDLARHGQELVAFVSLNCRLCIEILPGLRALERDGLPVHWVREDQEPEVFERWGIPGTPYVVHLMDGVVRAKGLVNTLEQVDWVIDAGTERQRSAA